MLRFLFLLLLLPQTCLAISVQLSYQIDQASGQPGPYGATADRSWATFDADGSGPEAAVRHLMAVQMVIDGTPGITIIDDPSHRVTPYISFAAASPRPRINLRQVWLHQPWTPSTAYAVGDKITVFKRDVTAGGVVLPAVPNHNGWWACSRAGTTGAAEPDWPTAIPLASGYRHLADSKRLSLIGAVVDNGDGTVNLPVSGTIEMAAGDAVTITGTMNYDGDYTLPDQTAGNGAAIVLTHAYVAETLGSPAEIHLTAGAAVDNGDGTVTLPVPGHGFTAGDAVTITGTTNYDGDYTLPAQTAGDADHLVITAAFVAEAFTIGQVYPTGGNVVDNGDGTVIIPTTAAHGLVAGDVIDIYGTANYNASYTLPAQTAGDATHIQITATFVAETLDESARVYKRVQDPDGSGAEWQYIEGGVPDVLSQPSGRLLVKDNGTGVAVRTGVTYTIRSQ